MSKYLLIALFGLGTAPIALAADGGAAPAAETAMECCNTTCPVCGKPINPKITVKGFKSEHGPKHPELKDATIGFDSDECREKFIAKPDQFEEALWNQNRNKKVK